jgi:hypothetical protein
MSLLGFKAQNHRQQTKARGPKNSVDDRGMEPAFFEMLHRRFNFTIDVAASDENARLPRYYTLEDDGLKQSWAGFGCCLLIWEAGR